MTDDDKFVDELVDKIAEAARVGAQTAMPVFEAAVTGTSDDAVGTAAFLGTMTALARVRRVEGAMHRATMKELGISAKGVHQLNKALTTLMVSNDVALGAMTLADAAALYPWLDQEVLSRAAQLGRDEEDVGRVVVDIVEFLRRRGQNG